MVMVMVIITEGPIARETPTQRRRNTKKEFSAQYNPAKTRCFGILAKTVRSILDTTDRPFWGRVTGIDWEEEGRESLALSSLLE